MRFTKFISVTALLLSTASIAQAQMVPDESFRLIGEISGLNVYSVEGQNGLWLISPDGFTVINGDLYDLSGPVPLLNYQPEAGLAPASSPDPAPAPVAEAKPPAASPAVESEGAVTAPPPFFDLSAPVETPDGAAAPVDDVASVPAADALTPPVDTITADLMKQAQGVLQNIDDAKKNEALVDLVARMDRATTPEEFKLSLIEWQADLEGKPEIADKARLALKAILEGRAAPVTPPAATPPAAGPSASGPGPAQATAPASDTPAAGTQSPLPGVSPPAEALTPPEPAPASPAPTPEVLGALEEPANPGFPQTLMPSGTADLVAPVADTAPDEAVKGADDSKKLFTEIRTEGLWFSVGRVGAPTVYAIIDPMCPYCARSISNLSGEIERGEIDLRVLLTPVISKAAPAKIAAILLSENPAATFVKHELEYAEKGASSLADRAFAELSAPVNLAVKKNHDIVIENGLPGVPFFAYVTNEGIRFSSGVPEAGKFSSALPDPFLGAK